VASFMFYSDYSGQPHQTTRTLYKEDFAGITLTPNQPVRIQLVAQLRHLLSRQKGHHRGWLLIPSLMSLSEQWQVDKSDVRFALETLRSSGYAVECPNDSRTILLYPTH